MRRSTNASGELGNAREEEGEAPNQAGALLKVRGEERRRTGGRRRLKESSLLSVYYGWKPDGDTMDTI